jgi:branched-chain amino acid transport system substrate-binding protein
VRHPSRPRDFSSFLLQAQAPRRKVIGLANAGGDTINSIKAANEFGITKGQKLAGLLMFITDIHALGLKTTQGMMFTEGFYWNLNDETRAWSRASSQAQEACPTCSRPAPTRRCCTTSRRCRPPAPTIRRR